MTVDLLHRRWRRAYLELRDRYLKLLGITWDRNAELASVRDELKQARDAHLYAERDGAKLRADLDRAEAHNHKLAKASYLADCERLEHENDSLRTQLLAAEARRGWGGFA